MALSLLRTFKKPVPEVFRDEVMDVIGASNAWKWVPYHNSYVEIDGKKLPSVSGGTRWGGGVWINSWDMARFGYLWLRGGKWGDKQMLPPDYVKAATDAERARPRLRISVVAEHDRARTIQGCRPTPSARGAPAATPSRSRRITTSWSCWRWHQGNEAEFVKRVIAAIKS